MQTLDWEVCMQIKAAAYRMKINYILLWTNLFFTSILEKIEFE